MNASARPDGVLLVSKPAGVTSHDVVERVRRSPIGRGRRVGHAGTLDPFATGLLLILVGRGTRVQRYLMALPKTYRTVARFGARSDSGDPTGNITETGERTSEQELRAALERMTGTIEQRVPLTSAVKVGGERLYRKARRGEQFETPVRTVEVSRLERLAFDETSQLATLELDCSSGTYVRQVVADLGDLCGAGAYCQALERLAIGHFRLEDADDRRLIGLAEALQFLPERRIEPDEARMVSHGRPLPQAADDADQPGPVRLTAGGSLVALAEHRDGMLKPVTVLSSAEQ
jgi:tRNA pseudouridine55 synthase